MLARFIDDDVGYLAWLNDHQATFVLNAQRRPTRSFLVVHRTGCPTMRGATPEGGWTTRQLKVCSTTREEIERWCLQSVGALPSHCQICKP